MNTRLLAAAARALADALDAPPDVPTAAPGADDLVEARASGIGVKLFCRLVRQGQLDGSRVGRRYLVRRSELDRWLADNAVKPRQTSKPMPAPAATPDDADVALTRALARGTLHVVKGR